MITLICFKLQAHCCQPIRDLGETVGKASGFLVKSAFKIKIHPVSVMD
jgi:hypothetical protein